MKRIVLWALSTLSVSVLLFGYSTSTSGPLATTSSTSVTSGAVAGSSVAGSAPPTESTSDTTGSTDDSADDSAATSAPPATSTVTGSVAQTRWGPVEVQLSLDGQTITDVAILQYPNGNGRDVEINNVALPQLIQDTLDAQSADIDMVSGATYTSEGYLESLQSALDQAGI